MKVDKQLNFKPYTHTVRQLFAMQKSLQELMFQKVTPVDSVDDFKYSVLGLIGELGEVLEADKRWKNIRGETYSRENKLDELVDCLAFVINMCLYSGFDSKEVCEAFEMKNLKNCTRFYKEQFERLGKVEWEI